MNKKILTIPKAAECCGMSRGSIWKYVKSGELRASLTPGGQYRITQEELERFMREKGMHPLAGYEPNLMKILIVDDDPQIQRLMTRMLSAKGYRVQVASDGFEAGVKVMDFRPGLVILDLFMSGMDGFEVCKRLKGNTNISGIKILAITGYDTEENRERILRAGADGYLAKPVERLALVQQIEDLLKKTC